MQFWRNRIVLARLRSFPPVMPLSKVSSLDETTLLLWSAPRSHPCIQGSATVAGCQAESHHQWAPQTWNNGQWQRYKFLLVSKIGFSGTIWYWVGRMLGASGQSWEWGGTNYLFAILVLTSTTGRRHPQVVRSCPSNDPFPTEALTSHCH